MEQLLKVAICAINSKYIHSSLAPWCLLAGIEEFCDPGIEAQVIEGTINEEYSAIIQRIISQKPQVIGFCCYIWNIEYVKKIVGLVKEVMPQVIIVLGGPEVSYNAADVLHTEHLVQFVVSSEGEIPFAQLLNAILKGEGTNNIPGISHWKGNALITSPPITLVDDPPSPYSEQYFAALNGRIAYLETSRGCPYSCAFCLSGCGNVRYFNLERAKRELLMLAKSGTRTVKLVDRTFNANKARAYQLISYIINNYGREIPFGVCIHFEIAGDILDDEMIDLLATAPAGSIQLEIGLQSFNPKTLNAIRRKTNLERLKHNIKRLISHGNIHIHLDLIAGLPYEDLKSFAESFNIAYELRPHMLQLGFLKLLHGSLMRVDPENYPCHYDNLAPYEVTATPWLSRKELTYLKGTENALDRLYNSGRFQRTLDYLLQQLKLTPFELFSDFGAYLSTRKTFGIDLTDFIALVLEYYTEHENIERITLRDHLVCDYLTTNTTGNLPPALKIQDPALKKVKQQLQKIRPVPSQQKHKRGIALLYSKPYVVYVDYQDKNPVTGTYPLKCLPQD